ncbi:MAG: energy transducer TonB [Nibricoccus sp.]
MKTSKIALLVLAAGLSGLSLSAQQSAAETSPCAQTDSKLCPLTELDKKPNPIKRVQPRYPADLKAARITGEAVISFVVDIDGSVKSVRVEKATDPAFGEAALAAVSAWEFEPGSKNGTPVACQLSLPLKFALHE